MKILAVILLTLLSIPDGFLGINLPTPPWKLREENRQLKVDNALLQRNIDSLKSANSALAMELDSLSRPVSISPADEDVDFELSDSLLHVWYIDHGKVITLDCDMESERFTSAVPDSVFIARLDAMHSYIPLTFNDIVKNYCILYSEKMRSSMEQVLGRCEYYWPLFDEILTHYQMPLELKALVIVESMLRPTAESRMGAKGIWQFMYTTARGYGMRIDSWMDERMDPVKSTEAAAKYLREAYAVLGDWSLAIASYNCGMGNVNKAIRRSGGKRGFWEIYDYLPRETRSYVPAFIGALYATHYYREYGLVPVKNSIAVPVDTFHIEKKLHFNQLEAVVGVPKETVAALNPQYYHEVVPGDEHPCVLKLPVLYTNAFIDAADSLYRYEADKLLNPTELKKLQESGPYGSGNRVVYKVKSGDVLGKIARKYGVTVSQIKNWNHLRSTTIRVGQKLVIYPKR